MLQVSQLSTSKFITYLLINLAAAFAKILDDFGISDKVSCIIQRIMNNKTHCTITCDNAWNNDTMIDDLLGDFPGESNRTRCFTHILNLVAKSIIKQFNVPKAQADVLNHAAKELAALAVDLDIEEQIAREGHSGEDEGNSDENEDDSLDGWTDVRAELSDEKREVLVIKLCNL